MRVFVTGGTGFIGVAIVRALVERGDQPVVLTRNAASARARLPKSAEVVEGDPQYAGEWQEQVSGCDAVVHLAGESVAGKRWDARFKQVIQDSRTDSTARVVEAIANANSRPSVLVSASGADFYPTGEELDANTRAFEDDLVDESTPPGSSFLARVCRHWEREAAVAEEHGVRVVRMRTGLVLGSGGALDRLLTPFKLFVGGKIGSGQQWTSWIHVADVSAAYLFALDTAGLSGAVNVVSPENARNKELSKALGKAISRPSWMPVPGFALRAAVGEFAEYILHGRRTHPGALLAAGFEFRYPELSGALENLEL